MSPDKRRGPAQGPDATLNYTDDPTVADASDNWPDRLARQLADRERRRAAVRAEREEHNRRRAHGLPARHATKLARDRR